MTIELKIEGGVDVIRALERQKSRYNRGFKRGLEAGCRYILGQSKRIVPVDTGFLKSSGSYRVSGYGFAAQGYVGYSAYYAVWVHENLTARHKPGKVAKYLEVIINSKKTHENVIRLIQKEMAK